MNIPLNSDYFAYDGMQPHLKHCTTFPPICLTGLSSDTHTHTFFSPAPKYYYSVSVVLWWQLPMGLHKELQKMKHLSLIQTLLGEKKLCLFTDELYLVILSLHTPQSYPSHAHSLYLFLFFSTDRLHKVPRFLFPPFPLCS